MIGLSLVNVKLSTAQKYTKVALLPIIIENIFFGLNLMAVERG